MKIFTCIFSSLFYLSSPAQYAFHNATLNEPTLRPVDYFDYASQSSFRGRKLFQRNTGMIIGWQRGQNTAIEFGAEAHWRKLSLLKPHVVGATAKIGRAS